MLIRLAIITTEGTGCADVVGDAALLGKPRDSDEIRHCLEMLVADPKLTVELGNAARKRLTEKFGWTNVAAKYASLYRELKKEHE